MFAVPAGRSFRNSNGKLGTAWGEIRGRNGILVVEPTEHSKPGGRYLWTSRGILPMLPEALAGRLVEHGGTDEDAATDAEVKLWIAAHPIGMRPGRVKPILDRYRTQSAGSRHVALTGCLAWACKEVNAGHLGAPEALREIKSAHTAALADSTHHNGAAPKRRDFWGALAWAVAQAARDPLVDGLNPPSTTIEALSGDPGKAADATEAPAEGDPARQDKVTPTSDAFSVAVADEAQRIRVREAARRLVAAERDSATAPGFDSGTLAEILARPAEPPERVAGLIPSDAGTLIAAMRKTGKTTLTLNLARCLLTGEDFLGRFAVRPVTGIVALLNYEVGAAKLAQWADEVKVDPDLLYLVNLRGRRNPLAHAEDRAKLAADLRGRGVETLIVDPFGRAYTGASQNDAGEVGAFLSDLDRFTRGEVGAVDLILTAHAGWAGERTRGSSALEDWADSIVTMVRDTEDETIRYLKATGRDVEVDEDRITFDPATRLLRLSGAGSRKIAKDDRKIAALGQFVLKAARLHPGAGVAELESAVKQMDDAPTFRNGEISKAARHTAAQGFLRIEEGGPGRKSQHYAVGEVENTPTHPTHPDPSRPLPGDDPQTPPTPPYRGGVGVGGSGTTEGKPSHPNYQVVPEDDDDEPAPKVIPNATACAVDGCQQDLWSRESVRTGVCARLDLPHAIARGAGVTV